MPLKPIAFMPLKLTAFIPLKPIAFIPLKLTANHYTKEVHHCRQQAAILYGMHLFVLYATRHQSPEAVAFGAILKPNTLQGTDDGFLVHVHILAKSIKRRILVTQFRVDEAVKHHRFFG
jgi:hypothetical protein